MTGVRYLLFFAVAGVMIGGSGCSKEQKKQVEERSTRVTLEPLQKRIFRR